MPSTNFIEKLREGYNEPILRFTHDSVDKTAFLVSVGEIRRDINLMPGYVEVTVDNSTGEFDDYLTTHDYLCNKASLTFGLGAFANVTLNSLSFHNNVADPDTIEDSSDSLLTSGFKAGMVFSLSGSTSNDDTYTIESITASAITLIATDALTDEAEGDSVTLIAEELPLFTGYVDKAVQDEKKCMTLTLRDRLTLALDNQIIIPSSSNATITDTTISFHNNSPVLTDTTISFHDNGGSRHTIEDSSSAFVTSGFKAGMVFTVVGSTSNNGTYTIYSVLAGTITLTTYNLTDESAGDSVTMTATKANDTITTSAFTGSNDFIDNGFFPGMTATITGSTLNNITVTIINVTNGTLTLLSLGVLAEEEEGDNVTITGVNNTWYNYFTGATRIHGMTVSVLVWNLLVAFSKLDSTPSTANTDIDYTSWLAWGVLVDNGGYTLYDIGVVANGETVNDILLKIARMTESVMWVGGEGKIKFQYGRTAGSWRTYKEELLAFPEIEISMEDRINYINCKWQYQPDTNDWLSDTSGVDVDSLAVGPTDVPYTYNTDYVQDPVVFHNSTGSTAKYMTARLIRTAAPPRIFAIRTQLLGFIEDIHSDIALQDLYGTSPYDDIGIQINDITFIPSTWETRIIGQYIWNASELPA